MATISEFLHVGCNQCGASLELPPGLRFVTCQFCGSRLEARFSGGAVFTEILDASNDGDRQIAHELHSIKLQNELQRLNQEWDLERDRYRSYGRGGQSALPRPGTSAGVVLLGLGAGAFGIFWIAQAASIGAPTPFILFGVFFEIGLIANMIRMTARQREFAKSAAAYEGRRQRLLDMLQRRG